MVQVFEQGLPLVSWKDLFMELYHDRVKRAVDILSLGCEQNVDNALILTVTGTL